MQNFLSKASKLRNLPSRRNVVVAALDIGSYKTSAVIAELQPLEGEAQAQQRNRTHAIRVLGIGHQRSRGIKSGMITSPVDAERSIRLAVDAAERMASVQIESVFVNLSSGRLASHYGDGRIVHAPRPLESSDINLALDKAAAHSMGNGRQRLHGIPTEYLVNGVPTTRQPHGVVCSDLSAHLHIVSCEEASARTLTHVLERAHLAVEAMVASPYASGLSTLVADEAEMGAIVIDFGAMTTSVSVFAQGHLQFVDSIALGGLNVTYDLARGLHMRIEEAEKLKLKSLGCLPNPVDSFERLALKCVGEDGRDIRRDVTNGKLASIMRPRVEEIIELVKERLVRAGHAPEKYGKIVLTGGACQLKGLSDVAKKILGAKIRLGKPNNIEDLPSAASNTAFACLSGLLIYPQMMGLEYVPQRIQAPRLRTGTGGYFSKVGRWLSDSF